MHKVDELIAKLPAKKREIVSALRRLILGVDPEIEETTKWGMPCYVRGGDVCIIVPYKAHVSLGFFRGGTLRDQFGLLENTGLTMRHVNIQELQGIRKHAIVALVNEAVALNVRLEQVPP